MIGCRLCLKSRCAPWDTHRCNMERAANRETMFLVAAAVRVNANPRCKKLQDQLSLVSHSAIGAQCSSSLRLDYRKLSVFTDQWLYTCDLQKPPLERRTKRRIALNDNRKMFLRRWFSPGDHGRVNPMLFTKDRVGDGECFTAFEQQWVNQGNSGPDTGNTAVAQIAFNAF